MRRIQGLDEYGRELEAFVARHDMPRQWFSEPDHIAIKCRDELDYEDTVRIFERTEGEIDQSVLKGCKISTIHLAGSVSVGPYGEVEWLEVMEPHPVKAGTGNVGIVHAAFFIPDLRIIEEGLDGLNVPWQPENYLNFSWLTLALNERNQKLKFTGNRLEEIVRRNRAEGLSHPRR